MRNSTRRCSWAGRGLRRGCALALLWAIPIMGLSQSFELMTGKRVFIDAQFLTVLGSAASWSMFSRARATAEYDRPTTQLFSGAYLNYTRPSGLGLSAVGRISSSGSGMDVGPHYFKATPHWMLYALPSVHLGSEWSYNWFSIFRYTPRIGEEWRLYASLELFSSFRHSIHQVSVQRLRLGVDRKNWQLGLALNLRQARLGLGQDDQNPGIFLRKSF